MRKILTVVLIGFGVFSLVLAGLLRFYAPSRVEKAPLDLKVPQQTAIGPAKVYNVATAQLEDVELMATRQVVADSAASDSKVAVNQVTLCIVKVIDDPPFCGENKDDPRIVRIIVDRAPADRKTGMAVNDEKYGENIDGAPVKHIGLTYKFPFHAKKTTYKFFDVNSKLAADARFIGTDKVKGLDTYKYEAIIKDVPLELGGGIPGLYSDTRVVWVEPRTGAIVKGTQHQVRTTTAGTPVLVADLAFTDATIDHQSKLAKDGLSSLRLLGVILPLVLVLLALLAFAGAYLLHRRPAEPGPSARADAEPQPAGRL
ncbi:MAG: DUF3068 domain-containing protein [Jatrophihabitantaceae bacterium]